MYNKYSPNTIIHTHIYIYIYMYYMYCVYRCIVPLRECSMTCPMR